MSDEIIPIVAGMPFGAPNWTAGEGFRLVHCPCCKNSMWLGPKQLDKVKDGAGVACMKCIIMLSDKETIDNMKVHHLGDTGEPTPLRELGKDRRGSLG